ncbi:hypothetical protein POM88_025806 [Heracleum sosnowskyi]|uniref:Uncharacterized protein n=1 Tax=Heracleum sosnowskyi TaxID=360622 RepID=A0AAD8I4M5_9APIA|nr:hypothetical protein POM88_025801 [Heracleum sosnowskyi]KAK1379062.1 hypothetical protein POM88_025806 [Heracleum sosnowskyi]
MMSMEEDYCEEGLACPPMDDFVLSDAFFFGDHQAPAINLDPIVFFDDDFSKHQELYPPKKKPSLTSYCGKGKEWNTLLKVLKPDSEILAKVNTFLEPIRRRRMAVEGATVPVTKARKRVKIIVKKSLNASNKFDTSMPLNDIDFELKFEATKRKIRDFYEQSNKIKKQRTTQLIDLRHLPPMPPTNKKSLKPKPKSKVGMTKTRTWNK